MATKPSAAPVAPVIPTVIPSATPPTTPSGLFEWLQLPGGYAVPQWVGEGAWATFAHDVGTAPAGYVLQRIDPRRPYGPDNLRWARTARATS